MGLRAYRGVSWPVEGPVRLHSEFPALHQHRIAPGYGPLREEWGERAAVGVGGDVRPGEVEEGRGEVRPRDELLAGKSARHVGAPNHTRVTDVLLVSGPLAGRESVLTHVVTVVVPKDEVSVVHLSRPVERPDKVRHLVVHTPHCT